MSCLTAAAERPQRAPRRDIIETVLWPTRAQLRRRVPQLAGGLVTIAVGLALMVRAELGLAPYEVLHQGISLHTAMTIGQATIAVGVVVLLAWFPLRQRPGLGTVVNVLTVGLMLDALLGVLGAPSGLPMRLGWMLVGIALMGTGIGLYIGAGLGPGPRDGLMTGLARRGPPVWVVRFVLEVTALGVGWLLGGTVGVGTVLFALGVPVLADWSLRRFSIRPDDVGVR